MVQEFPPPAGLIGPIRAETNALDSGSIPVCLTPKVGSQELTRAPKGSAALVSGPLSHLVPTVPPRAASQAASKHSDLRAGVTHNNPGANLQRAALQRVRVREHLLTQGGESGGADEEDEKEEERREQERQKENQNEQTQKHPSEEQRCWIPTGWRTI